MENIVVSLISSLILFDTTVAFQFLISQPLVACTLLGWLLGDIQLGIQIGVFLQLLWLGNIPAGAVKLPEGNAAAMVITTLIIRYCQVNENHFTVIFLAIIFGVLISYFAEMVVSWFRKFNTYLLQKVFIYLKRGKLHTITAINIVALISHYILMFTLIYVAINFGDLLFSYFYLLPMEWDVYFKYTTFIIMGIGVGLVMPVFLDRYPKYYILTGLLMGIIIFLSWF